MTVRILTGDCRTMLATMPDASVQCCVTSPPYFGLRDYQVAGQIGLEQTPDAYVAEMVSVFREVRRVLRDDGCVWLNLGDSYSGGGGFSPDAPSNRAGSKQGTQGSREYKGRQPVQGTKPKDLLGIPWTVAFALRADGWWLRSAITWCKTAPMPESVCDRPTSATEMVFLLVKSGSPTHWLHRDGPGTHTEPEPDYRWIDRDNDDVETAIEPPAWRDTPSAKHPQQRWRRINLWRGRDYFYDAVAIAEPAEESSLSRLAQNVEDQAGSLRANGGAKTNGPMRAVGGATRNARNWWVINPQPYSGAHFATMPPDLAERCIKAGTSERGQCPHCAAPWARVTVAGPVTSSGGKGARYHGARMDESYKAGSEADEAMTAKARITTGWSPTCSCPAHTPVPQTVLDPFFGAGTTGLVADRLGRNCVGIELNPDYVKLARNRVTADAPLFAEVAD